MSAHTPGPWFFSPLAEPPDEGGEIFAVYKETCGEWIADVSTEQDAHLIAAAPELLEALKEVLPVLAWSMTSLHPAYDKALAAIAKAEGRGMTATRLDHYMHTCSRCGGAYSKLATAPPPPSWRCERCEAL